MSAVDLFTRGVEDPITEPGIYTMPAARYHADPVVVPSLNNSVGKLLVELSPAHARAAHPRFNPELVDEPDDAQSMGTAAHAIFLQGENAVELVNVTNWRTKKAQEARAAIQAGGLIALKTEQYEAVHRMVSQLQRFRDATGAFTQGSPEQTLVWKEGEQWARARVDWLPDEPSAWLWDLKTSSGFATVRNWSRTAYQLGTDQQSSFYCRGAECVTGEPPAGMNFCVIENKPPHGIAVFSFAPAALEVAAAKVSHAIKTWTWCMTDNHWPSYPIEPQWIEPPMWLLREWEGLTITGAQLRKQLADRADNLSGRIIEQGNFGG